ncbi:hypothetical protein DPEC_G00313740 [Dallia pectoralis]|uniref:Uncharacterized protein n=1 Tax=Dallia pectoralis TaxID=75939 RepID=A0ACC2FC11_DALPE|nr:hypothetical protein DPEC_G00313740 [Dallia pectoralis]
MILYLSSSQSHPPSPPKPPSGQTLPGPPRNRLPVPSLASCRPGRSQKYPSQAAGLLVASGGVSGHDIPVSQKKTVFDSAFRQTARPGVKIMNGGMEQNTRQQRKKQEAGWVSVL